MKVAGQDPSLAVSAMDLKIRNGLSAVFIAYGILSVLTIKCLNTIGELMRGSLTSQEIFPLFPMAELFGDVSFVTIILS